MTSTTSFSSNLKLCQNGNFCNWSQDYKILNSRFSDLTVTPSTAQIVSVAGSLQLSCAMNLDDSYSTRAVTWKLNSGADVSLFSCLEFTRLFSRTRVMPQTTKLFIASFIYIWFKTV